MDSRGARSRAPEPARAARHAEALLVLVQRFARLVEGADGLGAGEEVDVDARDAVGSELDVARAVTGVLGGLLFVSQDRCKVRRDRACGAFREYAGLGCAGVRE